MPAESRDYKKLLDELPISHLWAFTRTSKFLFLVCSFSADEADCGVFAEFTDYVMSKPEGQRALAMRAIMGQVQADQEKTHVASLASDRDSVDGKPDAPVDPVRPLSFVPLTTEVANDRCPVAHQVVLKPHSSSIAEGKCPSEGGVRSPVKKRTKHLAQKKPQVERDSCHVIDFPGDSSTRKVAAEIISAAEGFFFPRDEEWLQSLSFRKFYEMVISSLYRMSSLSLSLFFYFYYDRFIHILYSHEIDG